MVSSTDSRVVFDLDLRGIVQLNVNNMEFFGFFFPEYKNRFEKYVYLIYSLIFAGFCYGLYTLSEIINAILVFGDIEAMTTASFLLLTHLVQLGKIYTLFKYGKRIRELINSLNRAIFKPKNPQQYSMINNYIKMSRLITIIFLIMCVLTCILWGIFPLIDQEDDGSMHLPLSGWYPFDTNKSPTFEIIYTYQTICACINGLSNISIDTFMSGLIMAIAGQLSLLNDSLENLGRKQRKDGILNDLQRIVEHHRNIIGFSNEVTFLFTRCIMAQFAVSVIIICITMFQMTLLPVMSIRFFSMALYQACMLLEIFLLCYYGNEVILKSMQLTESAYKCCWIDKSQQFKKNLVFFMIRSQVPLKLYAGGYFTLSLETFMAILKSSWSYFAVLNHVHAQ